MAEEQEHGLTGRELKVAISEVARMVKNPKPDVREQAVELARSLGCSPPAEAAMMVHRLGVIGWRSGARWGRLYVDRFLLQLAEQEDCDVKGAEVIAPSWRRASWTRGLTVDEWVVLFQEGARDSGLAAAEDAALYFSATFPPATPHAKARRLAKLLLGVP